MAKGIMIVDGQRVPFDGEKNVLAVIRKAGIDIPTFCYYSELSVHGACRMCMVEDVKTGKLDASCSMEPRDGMEIRTNTAKLLKHRRMILELLLAAHDCSCTTCNKSGNCRLQELAPDCIMTVETSGIPLAMAVARAFNVPLVIARHSSDITEGSTVNINYVSGSSKTIQTMAMPKRALQPNSRVLIVDDVMKGGGTAKGMLALAQEVGAQVVGMAFLMDTATPERKLVDNYISFFTLQHADEENQCVKVELSQN